jgi:hypothetical protein
VHLKLIEDVCVARQRQLRSVAKLTRNLDHAPTLMSQERSKAVPKVIRTGVIDPSSGQSPAEGSPPP